MVATHVWNRWLKEYLPSLITRKKWHQTTRYLQIGDLVLVVDHSTPTGSWPLGRVIKIFPGADGVVRSAEVQTKFGTVKRPVAKIALLEECPTS